MINGHTILSQLEWQEQATHHRKRAEKWTLPYRARRASRQMHPIYDFLFIYYRNKPSHLEVWHPGNGVGLVGATLGETFKEAHYRMKDGVVSLDWKAMNDSTRHRLDMALRLCKTVHDRPAAFGCFGMHEWAMVFRGDTEGEVRHEEHLPLRLKQEAIDAFVCSRPIQCSHFDAFRFFTPGAKEFNRIQPNKDTRMENEQCGCLHTNMDLYKLATQCMPWVGSDILWECFEFAVSARQLDMQAGPYDCESIGFNSIKVETPEGRIEYERQQRELSEAARPLRGRLIERIEAMLRL